MNPVDSYILSQPNDKRDIFTFFHSLFTNTYGLTPHIKWNIPTYYGKTWIFYINPDKKEGIHLCFMRGNELSNPQKVLESKGRKMVLSYHIKNLDNIPYKLLIENIEEAINLDKTVAFKVRKK